MQEAHITPSRQDQKKKSSQDIKGKILSIQNKESVLKTANKDGAHI